MRFWLREIAGWLLVALGLIMFYLAYEFLLARKLIEVGPLTFMGFIVFRGGIHLLKMAVAARLCLQAQQEVQKQRATPPASPSRRPARPRLERSPN